MTAQKDYSNFGKTERQFNNITMDILNSIELLTQDISDFLIDPTCQDLIDTGETELNQWYLPLNLWEYYITYSEQGIEGIKRVLIDNMIDSLDSKGRIEEVKTILADLQSSVDVCWNIHGSKKTTVDTVYEITISCTIINGSVVLKITAGEVIAMIEEVINELEEYIVDDEEDPIESAKTAGQKVMFLDSIGVIDFLKEKYKLSTNKVAEILSVFTDEKSNTMQRNISDIITGNKAKNNPYNSNDNKVWLSNTMRKLKIE